LLVFLVLLAACSSNGDGESTSPTSIRRESTLPAAVRRFVDQAKAPGTVAFRATYHVVRALGAANDVEVVGAPPSWTITAGDLVVIGGPKASTCHTSERRCVDGIREQDLEPLGVFSHFFADAPARALEADARRVGVGRITFSDRTVAGVKVRCAEVPIQGVTASTYCLTAEGVFALVDNTAVHYEITSYSVGRPSVTGSS
jgi:hypothetical protein